MEPYQGLAGRAAVYVECLQVMRPVVIRGVRSADRDIVGQQGRPIRVGYLVVHVRRCAGVAHHVNNDSGVGQRKDREGTVAHRHNHEVAVGVSCRVVQG